MAATARLRYVGPHDAIDGIPGLTEPVRRGQEFDVDVELADSLLAQTGNFETAQKGETR